MISRSSLYPFVNESLAQVGLVQVRTASRVRNWFEEDEGNWPLIRTLTKSLSSPFSATMSAKTALLVILTVRLSICRVIQRSRRAWKHSKKRPELRVGLPKATQMISVSLSVSAPSATSQTLSAMLEASSKTSSRRLPWLCRPAKDSVLCSLAPPSRFGSVNGAVYLDCDNLNLNSSQFILIAVI